MASLFKSKRSSSDSKSSSKSANATEPESKTQKGKSSSTSKSSSGSIQSPPPLTVNAGGGGGVAPNNSRQNPTLTRDRKVSMDMQDWLDTECPIDSRIMAAGNMTNNALSISRSGRFKAKGRLRARLFSEDADGGGSQDDHPAMQGIPRNGSASLATPEDRQTVLDAMAKRVGAVTPGRSPTAQQKSPAGGNAESGANRKSSSDQETSSKWSTTSDTTDL